MKKSTVKVGNMHFIVTGISQDTNGVSIDVDAHHQSDIDFAFADDDEFKVLLSSMIRKGKADDASLISVLKENNVGARMVRQMYKDAGKNLAGLFAAMKKEKSMFEAFGLIDQARAEYSKIKGSQ